MRLKAILAAVVLLLTVLLVIDQWAPEWRDEARMLLREVARVVR